MSIIKKHYDFVFDTLTTHPATRDSNELLYYRYLRTLGYDVDKSVKDFLLDMAHRKVPYIDSLARASRKVQENHPELRGKSYKERVVKKELAVRAEIRALKHY
jgi:hypothetical protein